MQKNSPTHHPSLIFESNPNGSPLTLGASTVRGGTVNRLLLHHRHCRRRQDFMAPHRFGHQVRSRLRWPRVIGTNSRHTLKPSRLHGRCTSSCMRVSLPTDVPWPFSQQQRFFFTTVNTTPNDACWHLSHSSADCAGMLLHPGHPAASFTTWHGMAWCGMAWCGMAWHGMAW